MRKIDRETVTRILDTADIVEVVSDFVTLKKRGVNYVGLCPFHSERTPSFSVSKAKGICKCFSCGKGGSPVNFLMELEQMSYQEALRWLARKYNIEIQEHEETDTEREQASLRESLFITNQYALDHFEHNIHDTEDGREIGLSYFTQRGLTPATIKKFHLGYSLDIGDHFYRQAIKDGFTEEYLTKTGLCAHSERGGVYDRFRGRVIYPVHTISGKVVAFGGRTLKSDKNVAKYVNSPESEIYSKSRELYGLYQARKAIVQANKCILVEGYMDVLSMSQNGVENVVASSGTSLTSQQVNLIHRFTENVTVIYDADAAGIKASLRGVDMLLADGMNVKVVLFPEGEDPDSFAQSHTQQELADYLAWNETDFIKFKIRVLMSDTEADPVKRSHAIASVLKSIAVIPDPITRQLYIEESARAFNMDPKLLALEVAKGVAKIAEDAFVASQRKQAAQTLKPENTDNKNPEKPFRATTAKLDGFERAIARYMLRYGMMHLCDVTDQDENTVALTVNGYVDYEFNVDGMKFTNPVIKRLVERIRNIEQTQWPEQLALISRKQETLRQQLKDEGIERIRNASLSMADIQKAEKDLEANINEKVSDIETEARRHFLEYAFLSDPDDEIRALATELVSDRYHLSKMHSKYAHVETEEEKLTELVPRAIFELKDAILANEISELKEEIKKNASDSHLTAKLLEQMMEKTRIRTEFARFLGERIVTPLRK